MGSSVNNNLFGTAVGGSRASLTRMIPYIPRTPFARYTIALVVFIKGSYYYSRSRKKESVFIAMVSKRCRALINAH